MNDNKKICIKININYNRKLIKYVKLEHKSLDLKQINLEGLSYIERERWAFKAN